MSSRTVINHGYCAVLILGVVFMLFGALDGWAEEAFPGKTVVVIGTGTIPGQNVETAKNQAVAVALAAAVETVMASQIPLQTRIDEFEVLDTYFYGNSEKYVQDFKVMAQFESNRYYRVLVQVSVDEGLICKQLAGLGIASMPHDAVEILFLISERNIDDAAPRRWWLSDSVEPPNVTEQEMGKKMAAMGLRVVDHEKPLGAVVENAMGEAIDIDDERAIAIGRGLNADVVVVGKSEAVWVPNTMGAELRSFQAVLTARALRIDSGTRIAATDQAFVSVSQERIDGGRKALAGVGVLAAGDLARQIISSWAPVSAQENKVQIIVRGTHQLGRFVKFRKMLKDIPGVKAVGLREIRSNEAVLEVVFEGTSDALAQALMLRAYSDFGINISETGTNRMVVDLVAGGTPVIREEILTSHPDG